MRSKKVGVIFALVIIAGIALAPRLMWTWYVSRAGRTLDANLQWQSRALDQLPTTHSPQQITNAIGDLQAALRWRPDDAFTLTRLGQAYAALSDWQRAKDTWQRARTLTPHDPTLPLMLERAELQFTQTPASLAARADALRDGGITRAQYADLGDAAFYQRHYTEARDYYERLVLSQIAAPEQDQFRLLVATFFAHQPVTQTVAGDAINTLISAVGDTTQVEAEDMRLINGNPIRYEKDPNIGVIFGNEVAMTLMRVREAGRYQVSIRARNTAPAPVQFQLELNGDSVGKFALARADNSWQELGAALDLQVGVYLIGVRFLNDNSNALTLGEIDRNLNFDWVRLDRLDLSIFAPRALSDTLRIEAEDMQSFSGRTLKFAGDPNTGVIFDQGIGAAVIDAQRPMTYRIEVRAQNASDLPMRFVLEQDGTTLKEFTIPRDEHAWREYETLTFISAGRHALLIRLLESPDNATSNFNYNLNLDYVRLDSLDPQLRVTRDVTTLPFTLQAEDMQTWEGKSLRFGGEPNIGVIFGQGIGVALINVPSAGNYTLTTIAQSYANVPLRFEVSVDYGATRLATIAPSDREWKRIELPLTLTTGTHIISVRLLPPPQGAQDHNLRLDAFEIALR